MSIFEGGMRRSATMVVLAATAAGGLAAFPTATETAAAAETAPTPVTITPNPASKGEAFRGWGTSLVWFANAR